jgi:hypothetical protein
MTFSKGRPYWLISLGLLIVAALVGWDLVRRWTLHPALLLEMISSSDSTAQVYYDIGRGFNEPDSAIEPVSASTGFQELRFPLKSEDLRKLRFDPLQCPGTVEIRRMHIVDADGRTVAEFQPAQILNLNEIKERSVNADILRLQTADKSQDSSVYIPLKEPVKLARTFPGWKVLTGVALVESPILFLAAFFLLSGDARARILAPVIRLDASFAKLGERCSSDRFIHFDRVAIWFYAGCAALFVLLAALDLNGTSMEFNTRYLHQYGPETVIAGTSKGIRSDEWNYASPDMFYQVFRANKLDAEDTPVGKYYTSLLGNMPVKHITTIFRPQFWGFFALPADYAFSFYWQMKWVFLVTGVFTLLLVLSGSSWLSAAGALWLFFSQMTQWTYTWSSGLPEMCGMLCYSVVFAMYLVVGSRPRVLLACAVLLSGCLVNFAMCGYVPHLAPYCWVGAFLVAGWLYARHDRVLAAQDRTQRLMALGCTLLLTGVMLGMLYNDAAPAIEGIANTVYPGSRTMNGGQLSLNQMASHYFSPFEDEGRFVQSMGNICEACGFEWLFPFTLLAWGAIRTLPRERKILLISMWIPALIILAWILLPVPAHLVHWLLMDRVMAQRALPALGLLNVAIVMVVLSAPTWKREISLDRKLLVSVPIAYFILATTNSGLGGYFTVKEVLLSGLWLAPLIAFLWDGRAAAFLATAIVPGIFFFGLVNPIARGAGAITSSRLFQFVESHPELRKGRWLVYSPDSWFGIFAACGLQSYDDYHLLPNIQDFPLFRAHGLNTTALNSAGFFVAKPAEEGKSEVFSPQQGREIWSVNPHDPMLKELHIRYIAFDRAQPAAMVAGLKPLSDMPVSGFWLYQVQPAP